MPSEIPGHNISGLHKAHIETELKCATEARTARAGKSADPSRIKPLPQADQYDRKSLELILKELGQEWIEWQCRMVAGIIRGVLFLPDNSGDSGSIIAIWPGEGEGEQQLTDVAVQALTKNRGVTHSHKRYGPEGQRICDLVATPLIVDNKPVAVVAVMLSQRSKPQQHAVLQLLQWGGMWMETLFHHQNFVKQEAGSLSSELMAAILSHSSFQSAVMDITNRLADQFGCERVSIGYRKGLTVRLYSLSHVASFSSRSQLVRTLEAAMEEAIDQNAIISYPEEQGSESFVSRAHAKLSEQHGCGTIFTMPLTGCSGAVGAITFEREAGRPFDKITMMLCESLVRIVAPLLELKQREERSVWSRSSEALLKLTGGVIGPARLKLKLLSLAAVFLLTALGSIDGVHQVTAPASIEGEVRQMLVASQEGYIKEAGVRAGDLVTKGQQIAVLDDRNLQLESRKWQGERNKIEKEYQDALARHERTKLSVLRARLEQVDTELKMVREAIERTQLRAPFDGIVVSGDLSQSLGAPVETGQVLFEIAPLESYRVVMEVDEHDVAGVGGGRSGHLIFAALPQSSFDIVVDQLHPIAVSGESGNYFRVEASLDQPSSLLRPGMHGVAKVDMGQRSLLWIWTHGVIDRVRLWLWAVGW
ncbi:efflux RND transporter periplasmic adaptor subunit [Amphritea sp. HPY]|uniref:efflux RND transporter periplasmic adaptor subunit n=1 Tax=Amphritea sp. HPY TaxID=3421652 RepID=UPI003D7EC594